MFKIYWDGKLTYNHTIKKKDSLLVRNLKNAELTWHIPVLLCVYQ